MAENGERRMLFDIRGRRKHVLRVIYAVLALLMGASLFLVVGPFNLAEVVGTGATGSAAEALEEQAERIEGRLAKDPTDEALLLALTRARVAAGNAQTEEDPSTATQVVTPEALVEFEKAQEAWERYLKHAGGEPNPSAAQLIAGTHFRLAESGESLGEIESNIEQAAKAQRIAAEARPNVGSFSTLAIYEYFNGDLAAGDLAGRRAEQLASSKTEKKGIEKQLAQYRKRGKRWRDQADKLVKQQRQRGKEELQDPLGGLSGGPSVAP